MFHVSLSIIVAYSDCTFTLYKYICDGRIIFSYCTYSEKRNCTNDNVHMATVWEFYIVCSLHFINTLLEKYQMNYL